MALEIDLVDELGTLDDAIKYVAESAELEDYKVEHVIPPAPAAVICFNLILLRTYLIQNKIITSLQKMYIKISEFTALNVK